MQSELHSCESCHVTHIHDSYRTYMNESRCKYDWVVFDAWMNLVVQMRAVCMSWSIHMSDMTDRNEASFLWVMSQEWSFIPIYVWHDMTHSYMYDMNHVYVWHDMTHRNETALAMIHLYDAIHSHVKYDSLIYTTRLIHMCTIWLMYICDMTRLTGLKLHSCDLSFIPVNHVTPHIYMGHTAHIWMSHVIHMNESFRTDAGNLSFIPPHAFDHALAFGVLTYVNDPSHACTIAKELLRITAPGGTGVRERICIYIERGMYIERDVYIYANELLRITAPGSAGVRENIHMYRQRCICDRDEIMYIYRRGCVYICERAAAYYCAGWHRCERENIYIYRKRYIYRKGCVYICQRTAAHYCAGWHWCEREHLCI